MKRSTRLLAAAALALPLAVGASQASVVPIVAGEYTSLRQYCDTRVDGRALQGDGANDRIAGAGARDLLRGGAGEDRLAGRDGGDCLQGQSGDDRVLAGAGADVVSADAGDDLVRAGPGVDTIACGRGADFAVVGSADEVARDCERVRVR